MKPGALTDLLRQVAAVPGIPEAEPAPLLPGAVIGRFEVVRELGRGGFGVVYEARDRELGRQVALKMVRHGAAASEDGKVAREAEAIARLAHPNLITLHDVGRSDHGPYLVFELLRGKTLQERIDEGPMPLQEAVHVAVEVARGLAYAHAEGVVHRDLKPSNVFVTARGQVKILDFGMAHAFGRRRLSGGTPAYMAPEQWTDEPEDERTDVFALGVMIHVMLSGEYPFPESGGRWAAGATTAPKLEVPGAPGLADLIDRMLEKAAKGRPRDGAAVLAALIPLEEGLRTRPADATPPSHARRRKATLGERLTRPGGRRLLGWGAAIGMGALLAVGAAPLWRFVRGTPVTALPEARPSIAVLPFADLSEKQDQGYLADGIAEELLGALSKVQGLRVPGRTSSFHFKGKQARLEDVGRELQVEHVLEGSVRSSGKRLRINAELVRISNGDRVWSETFEREFTDVFAIQDEIARAVVAALRVRLLPGQAAVATAYRTDNQEAYESYLLGKQFGRSLSLDSQKRALAAQEKAVQLDPGFAPAWAALASARLAYGAGLGMPWSDARRGALAAANHAVELAPDLPAALAARAGARMAEWDWAGAKSDIDRAQQIAPDDQATIGVMAAYAGSMGRTEEWLTLLHRRIALDPLNGGTWNSLAFSLECAGRLDEAERAYARALEVDPGSDYVPTNRILLMLTAGRFAEALALCPTNKIRAMCEAMAHHGLGNTRESQKALDVMVAGASGGNDFFLIANAQAFRGEKDSAFEWLEKARAEHARLMGSLPIDPAFRPLHGDPRWAALLRNMNLSASGEPLPATVAAADPAPSIAVLPFADMSEKHDQEYFADGVAEEILNALAQVKGLKVIGRTSSFSFKGKKEDLRSIGQQLGAGTLLEGSVRKQGRMLRITAQLIRATDGTHLWSQVFDRNEAKIFAVQDEIAQAVVAALSVKLMPGKAILAKAYRTGNQEAYESYLLGRHFARSFSKDSQVRAIAAFESALKIDPGFSRAWASLAVARIESGMLDAGTQSWAEARREALSASARAVELAPDLPQALSSRAWARLMEWDWTGAKADIDRALELDPDDVDTIRTASQYAYLTGHPHEAAALAKKALEKDPLDGPTWNSLGVACQTAGRFEEARRAFDRALEVDPQNAFAASNRCWTLLDAGRPEEGFPTCAAAGRDLWAACAYHALGRDAESQEMLGKMLGRKAGPFAMAWVYGCRGQADETFEWLERARVAHLRIMGEVKTIKEFRPLHSDPRWAELMRKMNLPVD